MSDRAPTDAPPDRDTGQVARAEWTVCVAEGELVTGDQCDQLLVALATLLVEFEGDSFYGNGKTLFDSVTRTLEKSCI